VLPVASVDQPPKVCPDRNSPVVDHHLLYLITVIVFVVIIIDAVQQDHALIQQMPISYAASVCHCSRSSASLWSVIEDALLPR